MAAGFLAALVSFLQAEHLPWLQVALNITLPVLLLLQFVLYCIHPPLVDVLTLVLSAMAVTLLLLVNWFVAKVNHLRRQEAAAARLKKAEKKQKKADRKQEAKGQSDGASDKESKAGKRSMRRRKE